ncbi:MAG: DUF5312 family protein [Alkalispirochaetaceae bacterium]
MAKGDVEEPRGAPPSEETDGLGFIEKIIAILFGGNDPERQKRRLLKQVAKDLNKSKYNFYKPRSKEALPGFAKFFYAHYRVVGPAQQLLQNAAGSKSLKSLVIDSYLTEKQRELRDQFDEESIRERAKEIDTKQLAEELKDGMINFYGSFDAELVKRINNAYNLAQLFLRFVNFDYYFALRKFDSAITENNFTYKPSFDAISAEYVVDDIRDFLETALVLDPKAAWDPVIDILKQYRAVEVVDRDAFKKSIKDVAAVVRDNVLEFMVRHITDDPFWKAKGVGSNERIVEPYLNALKTTTEANVQKLLNERREKKIDALVQQVFGTTAVARTKNYTEKGNLMFAKRAMAGFTHTQALNFLKAYLLDYFKKDVRELVQDMLLVRGKWVTNIQSQQLSDAYHQVMQISESLVSFDESLGEEGERGMKLKKAAGRVVERDPATAKLLKEQLNSINKEAQRLISEASSNLVTIGKFLKMLVADYDQTEHDLVNNWKELDGMIEEPIRERMVETYKQLYRFLQLMQVLAKR